MLAVQPADGQRLTERHVLALGLGISAAFVAAAAAAAIVAAVNGGSLWATIHLALAGAATVAIGAFMPHFAVTLAGTRPAAPVERLAALGLLAVGAGGAVVGVTIIGGPMAAAGSLVVVAGLLLVSWHTFAPLRDPLARRHHVVALAYGVALLELAAGVVLGGLAALGVPAVISAWATLRPAHAWLSLFGAVSLTIFGTLVYLAPTVLGARIRAGAALIAGTVGVLIGPPLTAVGFVLDASPLVIAGMAATLGGAVGQVAYVVDAYRRRGPYTSEHDWRRVAVGHLTAGTLWFAAAVAAALVELVAGKALPGWSLGPLAVPLVAGWMLQELVGSWTHLAPSVTPGTAASHAAQRRILAVASRSRLAAWNAGVALAWLGLWLDAAIPAAVGLALLAAAVLGSVVLIVRALTRTRY